MPAHGDEVRGGKVEIILGDSYAERWHIRFRLQVRSMWGGSAARRLGGSAARRLSGSAARRLDGSTVAQKGMA
jgi:hypothetical protein